MMKQSTNLGRLLLVSMWVMLSLIARSQNPTYEMYVTNQTQVSSKVYQFDVYLLRTGNVPLELATIQFGLGFDTMIVNGGSVSFTYVSGSSQLSSGQVPLSFNVGNSSQSLTVDGVTYRFMNQSARSGPGVGSGTVINSVKNGCSSPGTRIGTYRLTNTVDFRNSSSSKHIFRVLSQHGNPLAGQWNTAVNAYVGGSNVLLSGTLMGYGSVGTCDQNVVFNPCNVSASVAIVNSCPGLSNGSASITLSGVGSSSSGKYFLNDDTVGVSYSSNPFTISGLDTGSYSITVSSGTGPCPVSKTFRVNEAVLSSSLDASACYRYVLPWGDTVTTSGSYLRTYRTSNGCDSVVTANITINNSTQSSVSVTACVSYLWNGVTYTTGGVYTYSTTNSKGCDSVATLNLTINQPTASLSTASVCDSYVWNGVTYTSSGTYTKTFTNGNAVGCDSVATLNLTIRKSTSSTTSPAAVCGSYLWNGVTYTTSGTYTKTFTNAAGCDSVATLNVTIKQPTSSTKDISICGSSYSWNGVTYTTSGTYMKTFANGNAVGCDSVATLNLTIKKPTSSVVTMTVCDSLVWNGTVYKTGGVKTWTGTNAAGCDSTVTLTLTIKKSSTSLTTPPPTCGSYLWNGKTYTSSGVYTFSTNNAVGCDSIAKLNLTIKQPSSSTTTQTACGSFKWNGVTYTASGSYTKTFTNGNAVGCDSVATLNLTINQPTSSTESAVNCDSYVWNGVTYTASGVYRKTLTNAVGCDSVATLNLTIKKSTSSSLTVASCSEYYWSNTDIMYTSSGTYTWSTTNAVGCDSVVTLNLSIQGGTITVAKPTSILQELVSDSCGARVYRFTSSLTSATVTASGVTVSDTADGYRWTWNTSTVLGASAVVDSGYQNYSRVIRLKFSSNTAAAVLDSIKVTAYLGCKNSSPYAAKLSSTPKSIPAVTTAPIVTPLSVSNCTVKYYRYTAPQLSAATTTTVAATGWVWSFVGNLVSGDPFADTTNMNTANMNAVVVSGDKNSREIVVRYNTNGAAVTGDSVRVAYTSICGTSVPKSSRLTNTTMVVPLAPATLTISVIKDSCGNRVYRYTAPATLPVAGATNTAATGYEWDLTGLATTNGVVVDGNVGTGSGVGTSTIDIRYTTNVAASNADSVKVRYKSDCGYSLYKGVKLTNVLRSVPVAPASITISVIKDSCGNRVYRYTAPALPALTTANGNATGYQWQLVGLAASNSAQVINGLVGDDNTSGTPSIDIRYTTNVAATNADSVKVRYQSLCGYSLYKGVKLTNVVRNAPVAPATLTITMVKDTCGNVVYRYTAPSTLPGLTTTNGNATGYEWKIVGNLGASIDSGNGTNVIKVSFTSNNAASNADSVKVRYQSDCGFSPYKAVKLTNKLKTCATSPGNMPVTKTTPVVTPKVSEMMNVKVFPNPTTSNFNMQVISAKNESIGVRILDAQGRVMKVLKVNANETVNIGSELKPGAYFIEVRQGKNVKTTRVLKF